MSTARRRRARWPLLLLVLLLAAAAAGWVGLRGLQAERELEEARASLLSARAALRDADLALAERAVAQAGERTRRARRLTSDPVWRAAAAVPVAGASLRAASGVARAADELAREAVPTALDAARTLDVDELRLADGSVDVGRVRRAGVPAAAAADRVEEVQRALDALPRRHVLPSVAQGRAQLADETAELSRTLARASRALAVAPALLGDDRPRRYLVLVQQTSESRGTGGLPGGFAVLEADEGRLSVADSGSNAELLNGPVPVPDGVSQEYVQRYGDLRAFELWQNVNLSPDLPTVARVVQARWQAQGGEPFDALIALDAKALALVLRDSPPLEVGGRLVPAAGLERYLAVEQYEGVSRSAQRERKDALSDLASLVGMRLTRPSGSTEPLLRGLAAALRSGHLQITSEDPVLQPALRSAGVDGALPSGDAPLAYPVVFNASASKLDYFLERRVVYTAGPCSDGRRASSIVVELRNVAPATGLPEYVTIRSVRGRTTSSTTNLVALNVYATRGATLAAATLDGKPIGPGDELERLNEGVEAGLPVWQTYVDLPRMQTRRLVLQLLEPARAGAPRVPEQPLARELVRDVRVAECGNG